MAGNKNSIIVMDYDGCGAILTNDKQLELCISQWKQRVLLLEFIFKIQDIIDNSNNVYFISGSNRVNGKIDTDLALQNKNGESLVEFRKMIKYINDKKLTFIEYIINKIKKIEPLFIDNMLKEVNDQQLNLIDQQKIQLKLFKERKKRNEKATIIGTIINKVSDYKNSRKSLSNLENDVDTTEDKQIIRLLLYEKLQSFNTSEYKPIIYVDLSTQFGDKFSHVNEHFDNEKFGNNKNGEVDVKVEIFKSVIGYMDVNSIQQMYYFDDDAKIVNNKIVSRFFPAMIKWCNKTKSVDNGFEYSGKYIELIVFDYQLYLDLNPNVDLCYVKNKTEKCERVEPPEEEELCNIELRF